ncbi:hypothetical protein [Jatrophihabitans endophyticus]|uniref:hypothetical protein n=1 Tax=Jatrophihabitans endophyticus TaxID=1206085 RepID=UPI0019FA9476|nr:hypothetical protein [Jatrophihabitans endophyticus]MBE7188179.1 hypothetical protein [Jatrophihabitans endophyticus]
MPDARPASRAPWIIAAVAGVVFVVALVVYFVPLAHAKDDTTTGQLTTDEMRATAAAATETANFSSLSRAHFARDYRRSLAGATGALRKDIASKRAATLKVLTAGKFDLSAQVTHSALVGPSAKGDGYVVLVTLAGYKSTAPNTPVQSDLQVTVVRHGSSYLASDVTNIGVSG